MPCGGRASASGAIASTAPPFTDSAECTSARTRNRLATVFPARRWKSGKAPPARPGATSAVAPSSADIADKAYDADLATIDFIPPGTKVELGIPQEGSNCENRTLGFR